MELDMISNRGALEAEAMYIKIADRDFRASCQWMDMTGRICFV